MNRRSTPEQFPPASSKERGMLFANIGLLAVFGSEGIARPGIATHAINLLDGGTVPTFITERLPRVEGLTTFAVRAVVTSSRSERPSPIQSELVIQQKTLGPEGRHETSWTVTYRLQRLDFDSARTVQGVGYDLPAMPEVINEGGDIETRLRAQLASRITRWAAINSSTTPRLEGDGPWPDGLVRPEVQQLNDFTVGLLPPDAAG
jgi:hypothetical protein